MTPKRYRKKPVEIEAAQYDGTVEAATTIIDWVLDGGGTARWHEPAPVVNIDGSQGTRPAQIAIDTLEGTMRAVAGDYVIRGVAGEFYPCKAEIFEATYVDAS